MYFHVLHVLSILKCVLKRHAHDVNMTVVLLYEQLCYRIYTDRYVS